MAVSLGEKSLAQGTYAALVNDDSCSQKVIMSDSS